MVKTVVINMAYLVYFSDGKPHTPKDLMNVSGMNYATVMRNAYRLIKNKCLKRLAEGKRPVNFIITDLGAAVLKECQI